MFKLETNRLILRDMALSDEEAFVAISQHHKYQRFYDESDCAPEKYQELTKLFVEQSNEIPRTSYQLAIECKSSGNFIGTVCLRVEENKQASIGCGMSTQSQGRGLIDEAASALVNFAFNQLDIHRIYAETISRNLPAIKLCKSLGMRKEAHFHQHRFFKGKWWDTVVLAILKTEWDKTLTDND